MTREISVDEGTNELFMFYFLRDDLIVCESLVAALGERGLSSLGLTCSMRTSSIKPGVRKNSTT